MPLATQIICDCLPVFFKIRIGCFDIIILPTEIHLPRLQDLKLKFCCPKPVTSTVPDFLFLLMMALPKIAAAMMMDKAKMIAVRCFFIIAEMD
jgi:hypothetical protein